MRKFIYHSKKKFYRTKVLLYPALESISPLTLSMSGNNTKDSNILPNEKVESNAVTQYADTMSRIDTIRSSGRALIAARDAAKREFERMQLLQEETNKGE